MKRSLKKNNFIVYLMLVLTAFAFTNCEDDDNPNNNNANLRTSNPRFSLDLTLITNAELNQIQGDLFVPSNLANGSIQGVYVRNTGIGFVAFEIAEPNHIPGDCNLPRVKDGVFLEYMCGDKTSLYNAGNGQKVEGDGEFPLKAFRVEEIKDPNRNNVTVQLIIGG